jgi:hypothetical protein
MHHRPRVSTIPAFSEPLTTHELPYGSDQGERQLAGGHGGVQQAGPQRGALEHRAQQGAAGDAEQPPNTATSPTRSAPPP